MFSTCSRQRIYLNFYIGRFALDIRKNTTEAWETNSTQHFVEYLRKCITWHTQTSLHMIFWMLLFYMPAFIPLFLLLIFNKVWIQTNHKKRAVCAPMWWKIDRHCKCYKAFDYVLLQTSCSIFLRVINL